MRLAPGPVMIPPSGKLVYDKDGERVDGYKKDDLVDALTEMRRANGRPIGDPERDVDRVLAGVEGYSSAIPISDTEERPEPKRRLIDRVNSWLMNQYSQRGSVKFVTQLEANRRAQICESCPRQKNWKDSCTSCNSHAKALIDRNIVILSQNKQVEAELQACTVTGHENKVAVWLDKDCLKSSILKSNKTPEHCWLRGI